jgi:phosphoribosyl 1,2-cyclic phosphodiesterase
MDKIKFLGTAGARFVVIKQFRKSGGIWITLDNTNLLIDPGPGSLIRCLSSKPKLNPKDLDGIILSHKHIDHSNDINIMIEAMTDGGYHKKGIVFAPKEAFSNDPVILNYIKNYLEDTVILNEKNSYKIGNITFDSPIKNIHHGAEGYGFNFHGKNNTISVITDTKYFKGIESHYKGDILIINVVFYKENKKFQHLCIKDVDKIISKNKPKLTILTHFGMTMLKAKPWEVAEELGNKLGLKVIAANDGMEIKLDDFM